MAGAAHDDDLDAILALTPDQRVERAVQKLPTLSAQDVPLQDSCPICLLPFPSIISGENVEPESPGELVGVTKLQGCGHVFCRLDLIEWIRGRHGTCPACRHVFLDVKPASESDGESSDGDYVPGEEDYDEDEDFEFEFTYDSPDPADELDDQVLASWDEPVLLEDPEPDENWGLSDGDSLSEGDGTMNADEALEADAMIDDDFRVQYEEEGMNPIDEEGSK